MTTGSLASMAMGVASSPVADLAPTPATWLATWRPDLGITVGLLGLVVLYARVVRRLWMRRHGAGISPSRVAAFVAGIVVLGVAVLSPLDTLGAALLSAHMVQHLLLALLAAPLLVAGRTHVVALHLVPLAWRRRVAPPVARTLRRVAPLGLVLALGLHVGVMLVWHLPGLYAASLQSGAVHALEHVSLLVAAVPFWIAVGTSRTTPVAAAGLAAFVAALAATALAAGMTFAPTAWYAGHLPTTTAWGLTPLQDQQLAAAILWVPGGMAYLATCTVAVVRWLRADERRHALAPGGGTPRPVPGPTPADPPGIAGPP
ncbi:cytochrome c oxidase assembly protein [Salsipaludibacter albus]|uniref:cytochrome c oxidase assembly protein n=1 Tax=Salsipaludibacter albus TaxID=2849650 RepID=UPI001EE3CA9C|nr:cytochrome c oxidase assembly protein [Salsipaludibacter albus]MBY5161372.1 cytochrome c oxidase assembly protein [Salsipaludibacter albus]